MLNFYRSTGFGIDPKTTDKIIELSRFAKWHKKVNQSGFK